MESMKLSGLDEADMAILKATRLRRLKSIWKACWISLTLPLFCGLAVVIYLDAVSLYGMAKYHDAVFKENLILPDSWNSVFRFVAMCYLFGYLSPVAGVFMMILLFFRKILPVLRDTRQKTKRIYPFTATKYSLPEFDDYFIQTPVADFPFFRISPDAYHSLSGKESLEIEVLRWSNTFLGLKFVGSGGTIPVI